MKLEQVKQIVVDHMLEIEKLFKPHMQITFIARCPGDEEQEMVITKDYNLEAIKNTLERSMGRETK